jgi:hypothetical protein
MAPGFPKHTIQNNLVIPPGETVDILDEDEQGQLLFALISAIGGVQAQSLTVLLQLDGMPGPDDGFQTIDQMGTLGLDEKIEGHWWITKWDIVANRYVIVYTNDNFQEMYENHIRLMVRNPTAFPITIERFEMKRLTQCSIVKPEVV